MRSDVGDAQRQCSGPVAARRRSSIPPPPEFWRWLHALRRESRAGRRNAGAAGGRRLHAGHHGQQRRQADIRERSRAVIGRQRIQQEAEIVDQRIVDAESGADRGLSVAEDVPGQADPRAEQMLRVVGGEDGIAHQRRGQRARRCIGDVIGGPVLRFVPAGGEFVAQADAQR